jgi:broad specificity phosphatase PhoE
MRRVRETLEPLLEQTGHTPNLLPELREVDFGVWTGLTWDEVHATFGVRASTWLAQMGCGAIAEAEPLEDVRERVQDALRRIEAENAGQPVAVVCHGGVIRMILSVLMRLPLDALGRVDIEYASLTVVDRDASGAELRLLNFAPWRDFSQPVGGLAPL